MFCSLNTLLFMQKISRLSSSLSLLCVLQKVVFSFFSKKLRSQIQRTGKDYYVIIMNKSRNTLLALLVKGKELVSRLALI